MRITLAICLIYRFIKLIVINIIWNISLTTICCHLFSTWTTAKTNLKENFDQYISFIDFDLTQRCLRKWFNNWEKWTFG